jgi:deoxyribodipyrimidine photo-lyase
VDEQIPSLRIRSLNGAPARPEREFVLYWMIAARRTRWNFALDRALDHGARLGKPVLILEALRADYPWASDRLHAFVLRGMADNARRCAAHGLAYYPYVEPSPGAGRGLLASFARHATVVVTDDYPSFFLRPMSEAAASRLDVALETVDSNGLVPLRATDRAYPTAFAFRAFLHAHLRDHLRHVPRADPLAGVPPLAASVPRDVGDRWPAAPPDLLDVAPNALARLPVDHSVGEVRETPGGSMEGERVLARFLDERLDRYAEGRNTVDLEATSGLSPYLHFGHVSAHQVFHDLMTREQWTTRKLASKGGGRREGWWGVSRAAEAFLDQLVTWREIGFNMCEHRPRDYDRFASLPPWAQATLTAHASDPRPRTYDPDGFEAGQTHDPLWNAAQGQLRHEGRIHNYLRMLWGKKILEWSRSPEEALAIMIELNNKYALDGRDPNSYSGIFWTLGRYDRPWGPQRPVFGTVRYMSSENTARKMRVRDYVARYGPGTSSRLR